MFVKTPFSVTITKLTFSHFEKDIWNTIAGVKDQYAILERKNAILYRNTSGIL